MDIIQKRILTRLAEDFYRPVSAGELAKGLRLEEDKVKAALTVFVEKGILEVQGSDYFFNPQADTIAGHYQAHAKGYGFVHVGGDIQYYVAPGTNKGAKDGDIVLCSVQSREPGKAPLVKIDDFLVRTERLIAAKFKGGSGLSHVQDGSRKLMIPARSAGGARDEDCVLVSVSGWEGRVVHLLDKKDQGRLDLLNIAAKKGIVPVFSAAAESEAAQLAELSPGELERRLNLLGEEVITVDGDTAMDLDDGFSLSRNADGNWRLCIHIADVAHFVRPGSALDREAFHRALSVYLIDREVPMLPARLSRSLCSLLPGEVRPAVSCIVIISPQGAVLEYKFADTVIRSRQRLTYAQVDQGGCGQWTEMIAMAGELVKLLNRRRRERGTAYITLPATSIKLNEDGQPVAMGPRQSNGAREMVEEFMILVNELAADFLFRSNVPILYRGNEGFNPERGDDLSAFISRWGLQVPYPPSSRDLQVLLDAVSGRPEQIPVYRKLARCLHKSRYSSVPLGHYNLAVERYTHFSSPIRRYADLYLQRLVKELANSGRGSELERDLPRVAEQCSFRERLAQDVEGECLELKKLQFLESAGDTQYSGQVVDTASSGPYVLLDNTADGIVSAGDKEELAKLLPGDRIRVRVHKLDLSSRQVSFALCGENSGEIIDRPET